MTDTDLIRELQQQCLSGAQGDFALITQACTFLPDRALEALAVWEGVCRRQKLSLSAVGFAHCAGFVDKCLTGIQRIRKRLQETPPSRDSLVALAGHLGQIQTHWKAYYDDLASDPNDGPTPWTAHAPALDPLESWPAADPAAAKPVAAAPVPAARWTVEVKQSLKLFDNAIADLVAHPVESVQVAIGVCRSLHAAMRDAGFQPCAGYLQSLQTALLVIETQVASRLGKPEDLKNLGVLLQDVERDLRSYFQEIEEFASDAPERAEARAGAITFLTDWRKLSPTSEDAPAPAPESDRELTAVAMTPEKALAEGKRVFPLMREAAASFLTHPLESVRALGGACRQLEPSLRACGFTHFADLIHRTVTALSQAESSVQAQVASAIELDVLQLFLDDLVRAVISYHHEIAERGLRDMPECAYVREEYVTRLSEWKPGGITAKVAPQTPDDGAADYLREAAKEIRLFQDGVESFSLHPTESIAILNGVCQRLAGGLQVIGFGFFSGHVSSIGVAIDRASVWLKRHPPTTRGVATLAILLDDIQRSLHSYLQEVTERHGDAMECAQVRSDTLSALLGWSGGEGQESLTEEEARAAEPSDESKRELFFRDAERTIGLMSEAIGVLRHHPAESLTTASRLCHTLAERFDGMGYVFGAVFIRDIEGTLEGLLRRLPQGMVPGMDKAMADLTIQIDEVALSLVSYLDELQQRGEDLAECAESRIYLVEALVAWNPTVAPPPAEPANPADLLLGAVFGRDDSTAPPLEPPPAPVVPPAPSAAAVVEPWPVPRAEEAEAPRYSAVDSEPEWEVWTGSWQDEEPEPAVSPGGSREPGAVEYLIFECRGQEYALPVGALAEVVRGERVLPLPYDRPEVAGVVNYQGEAVPVLRLDGEPHAEGAIARYLLIVGRDESRCGIEAERISRIASLAPRDFRPCAGARWTPFTCQTLRVVDL